MSASDWSVLNILDLKLTNEIKLFHARVHQDEKLESWCSFVYA